MRILAIVLSLWGGIAGAVECSDIQFERADFTICEVDARSETIRLFLRDENGDILGSFSAVENAIPQTLTFAMNAGMYHDDRAPVGHYVENGLQTMRVIPNAGPGNFGLLPNGVFCIREGRADVIETLAYLEQNMTCDFATQSGPMLVIDGALHPRFISGGTSKNVRNGVGTNADGTRVVFAISNDAVNFDTFGRLFRDHLNLPNALYFDGRVSRLFSPALGRSDFGPKMGPIVGVIE